MPQREKKIKEVELIRQDLEKSSGVFLVDFTGLKAQDMLLLRRRLKEVGSHLRVVKNALALRAISGTSWEGMREWLVGPTALVVSFNDPILSAKIISTSEGETSLRPKGGMVGEELLSSSEIKFLGTLPSREVLLAQTVGRLKAPFQQLSMSLGGLLFQLVGVIKAWEEKKRKEASSG